MVPDTRLALLSGQRGIWLADRADPVPGRFLNAQASLLLGEIDCEIFARAAMQVVSESECLRVRVHEDAGGITQGVLPPPGSVRLPIVDLSATADPDAAALAWMEAARADPIDPTVEPPFAWALLRLGSGRTIWSQIYHHVVIDSTGRNLVVARLAGIYDALLKGREVPAPATAPDLAGLVAREAAYLASRQCADDLQWCLSEIDDPPPLPSPSRRAAASSGGGFYRASRGLGADVVGDLRGRARDLDISLPQLFCAAWGAFLARISGNDEILFGLQVAGRSAATRESIATLTNVLPLRIRTSPTVGFDRYAAETGRQVRLALRHQHHPHQRMRAALGLSPIAPDPLAIGFNYAPASSAISLNGIAVRTRNLAHGPVQEVSLGIEPGIDGSIELDLDANQRRYTEGETGELADRFVLLLRDIVKTEGRGRVSRLAISEPEEQRRVLGFAGGERAAGEGATTLPAIATLRHPQDQSAPALIAGDARLSYAMLDAAVNRMARYLIGLGVGPGKIVALALPRTESLIIALLAVCRSGAAFCPLDPEHPSARLAHMLMASGASLLLTTEGAAGVIRTAVPILCLDSDAVQSEAASCLPAPLGDADRTGALRPDMLAYVIFTSGSTGVPKPVAVSQASLCCVLRALAEAIPMQPGQVMLSVTTIAFDVAIADVFLPLLQGGVLVLLADSVLRDPVAACGALRQHQAAVMQATPSYWRTLPLEELPANLCAVIGGEAFPVDLLPQLSSIRSIINVYGPTETTIWVTAHEVRADDVRDGIMPVGRPLPGCLVWILDREGRPVPPGLPGELHIGGSTLADGYLGDAELTDKRFIPCPFAEGRMYRTGDIARWREDGLIEIFGRVDGQLKISGHRVEPGEIENAIRMIPGVEDAAVVLDDGHARPTLIAYIVVARGFAPLDREALRLALSDRLPVWMLPSACVNLDRLPRNATGKLDRAALRGFSADAPRASRPPANRDEVLLCGLFARVCNTEQVGAEDDFFDLGGDSLAAMLLVTEARQHGRTLSLPLLFGRRTPAGIAAAWTGAFDQPGVATADRAVFLIPGMGGDAPALAKLRVACEARINLVLVEYPDWPELASPAYGMARLAEAFATRIERLAPSGVIRLMGYSLGGLIAWEVARLLSDRGRDIGFVGLLDCATERPASLAHRPAGRLQAAYWDARSILGAAGTGRFAETCSSVVSGRLIRNAPRRYTLRGLAKLRGLPIPLQLRYWLHRHVSEVLHAEIVRQWRVNWLRTAVQRDLPAVLFRAENRTGLAEDLGWSAHCRRLEIVTVAGGHESMLGDDRLGSLADAIVGAVNRPRV